MLVYRSLLELANQSLSPCQLDDLVASMFTSAGLQQKQEMTFADFQILLADHREQLGYVQLSFNSKLKFVNGFIFYFLNLNN